MMLKIMHGYTFLGSGAFIMDIMAEVLRYLGKVLFSDNWGYLPLNQDQTSVIASPLLETFH